MSSTAFQAFRCESFDNDKSFLQADFSVECGTPEYADVHGLAWAGILLYPVSMLVLYAVLLRMVKRAVLDDKPTELSRALSFLICDFEKSYYWWELFEGSKKLFLVGFCVHILPGSVLQLLVAFMFSLVCMLFTAVASPFVSDVDDTIAKAFGVALSAVFFTAVVIKVNVLTESMEGCLNQQLRQNFEFNLVAVSICMTAAVALALVVTVLVAVHQLVRAARAPVIKLRSTSARLGGRS